MFLWLLTLTFDFLTRNKWVSRTHRGISLCQFWWSSFVNFWNIVRTDRQTDKRQWKPHLPPATVVGMGNQYNWHRLTRWYKCWIHLIAGASPNLKSGMDIRRSQGGGRGSFWARFILGVGFKERKTVETSSKWADGQFRINVGNRQALRLTDPPDLTRVKLIRSALISVAPSSMSG